MGPLSAKADLCFYIFRVEAEKRELSASQKSKFSLLIKTQKNLEKQLQEAGQEINELRKTVTFSPFPILPAFLLLDLLVTHFRTFLLS